MGRPELGTTCTCTGCSERFYDLNRSPQICPTCGAQQPPERPRAARPSRSAFGSKFQPRHRPEAVIIDDDVEPASTSDPSDEDDALGDDDETDADAEIDTDLAKAAD